MDAALLLRLRIEDFLFEEADLLDQWKLDEWLALFTDDARYYVPPTDLHGDDADPNTSLFYVFDDRHRMSERVIRLKKAGAHSEWPRSKTRHLVSNVRVTHDGKMIRARASFAVWRSKDVTSDVFVGHYLYEILADDAAFRIRKKTCVLDMEALRPHARISIIL
jgi:p-cumate 2,3-dioxygenase beta subunit